MSRIHYRIVFLGLLLLLSFPLVSAHVPIAPADGDTLETAIEINNPTKSWVIYSELHEAQHAQYFTFEMNEGDRIRLILSIPIYETHSFYPVLVLMGPGIADQGTPPTYIEHPEDAGIAVYEETGRHADYEGFTPTSFYKLIDIDTEAPETGRYYVAVFEPEDIGGISLAVGYRETFTLQEWILVPISVITIHQWNGQSLLMIFLPFAVVLAIGILLYYRKSRDAVTQRSGILLIGQIAAFLFIASGVAIFYQMIIALLNTSMNIQILITTMFGLIPILLGRYASSLLSSHGLTSSYRGPLKLLFLSVVAIFAWSGLIIGPILLFIAGTGLLIIEKKSEALPEIGTEVDTISLSLHYSSGGQNLMPRS